MLAPKTDNFLPHTANHVAEHSDIEEESGETSQLGRSGKVVVISSLFIFLLSGQALINDSKALNALRHVPSITYQTLSIGDGENERLLTSQHEYQKQELRGLAGIAPFKADETDVGRPSSQSSVTMADHSARFNVSGTPALRDMSTPMPTGAMTTANVTAPTSTTTTDTASNHFQPLKHSPSDLSSSNDLSCHFENGIGEFQTDRVNDWRWIPKNCSNRYDDYIKMFSSQINSHNRPLPDPTSIKDKKFLTRPLKVVALGDSLDRNLIRIFCDTLKLSYLPFFYDINNPNMSGVPNNRGLNKDMSSDICANYGNVATRNNSTTPASVNAVLSTKISTTSGSGPIADTSNYHYPTPQIDASYFRIYGMYRTCECGNFASMNDSRVRLFNSTIHRIKSLLPHEVLNRLPSAALTATPNNNNDNGEILKRKDYADAKVVFFVHSALWDLSKGCNDETPVTEEYQSTYEQGILDMYNGLKELVPDASIYWRTTPPVTLDQDQRSAEGKRGRTRVNQITLNDILRRTVSKHELGIVVDWWSQIVTGNVTEAKITSNVLGDGIHYKLGASYSFFNMFLNTLFDREPELLHIEENDEMRNVGVSTV